MRRNSQNKREMRDLNTCEDNKKVRTVNKQKSEEPNAIAD